MQYSAQKKQAKAQEAAAEYNAKVIQNQALHENEVAAVNAQRASENKRRRLSSIRANRTAGAGLTFSGSVADQLEASNFQMERDIQDSVYQNSVRQGKLRQQASNTVWEGKQKAAGTRANANASLLMGAADIGSSLYGGFDSGALSF